MREITKQSGGVHIFIDALGDTGNQTIRKYIALTIASSGFAATLLGGGRTAHLALKLPYVTNVQCVTAKHWKRVILHCEI